MQELCEVLTRQCMHPSMQMEDMAPEKTETVSNAWKRPSPLVYKNSCDCRALYSQHSVLSVTPHFNTKALTTPQTFRTKVTYNKQKVNFFFKKQDSVHLKSRFFFQVNRTFYVLT